MDDIVDHTMWPQMNTCLPWNKVGMGEGEWEMVGEQKILGELLCSDSFGIWM